MEIKYMALIIKAQAGYHVLQLDTVTQHDTLFSPTRYKIKCQHADSVRLMCLLSSLTF